MRGCHWWTALRVEVSPNRSRSPKWLVSFSRNNPTKMDSLNGGSLKWLVTKMVCFLPASLEMPSQRLSTILRNKHVGASWWTLPTFKCFRCHYEDTVFTSQDHLKTREKATPPKSDPLGGPERPPLFQNKPTHTHTRKPAKS